MELKKPIFKLFFLLALCLSTKYTFVASREIDNHPCLENQFKCETGDCVSLTKRCDGKVNCPDLSDEINCNHTDYVLKPEEYDCRGYKCGDGTCLPSSKNCDGIDDCDDDEKYCGGGGGGGYWNEEERNCDSDTHFKCSNGLGECIPKYSICDGYNDCGDLSDEQNCTQPENYPCGHRAYECDDKTCLPKYKVCDGIPDCDSDETFCSDGKQCDLVKNFKCNNGECIGHHSVCNGYNDCGDLSDEMNCCDFTCASTGTCLIQSMRCDGIIDCADLSDEKSCHHGHPNGNRRR